MINRGVTSALKAASLKSRPAFSGPRPQLIRVARRQFSKQEAASPIEMDFKEEIFVSPFFKFKGDSKSNQWELDVEFAKEHGLTFNDQDMALVYDGTSTVLQNKPGMFSTFLWATSACATCFSFYVVPTGIPYFDFTTASSTFTVLTFLIMRSTKAFDQTVSSLFINRDGTKFYIINARGRGQWVPRAATQLAWAGSLAGRGSLQFAVTPSEAAPSSAGMH